MGRVGNGSLRANESIMSRTNWQGSIIRIDDLLLLLCVLGLWGFERELRKHLALWTKWVSAPLSVFKNNFRLHNSTFSLLSVSGIFFSFLLAFRGKMTEP